MAERADAHTDRNLARQLTPAEKAEKKARVAAQRHLPPLVSPMVLSRP